jgi:hypothetical protein
MRKTKDGDQSETGLSAALKGTAVVLAIGMLALMAGRTAYSTNDGNVELPAAMMPEPARSDAPNDGQFTAATGPTGIPAPRMLAAGPAGISAPGRPVPEAAKPTASPTPQEEPVATF